MAKSAKIIQSLDRGIKILDLFKTNPKTFFSLPEVAAHLDVDPSTAFRLLFTLTARGYVAQHKTTKAYSLGPMIFTLYGALLRQESFLFPMRESLEKLAKLTGETSHLAIRDKNEVVFIDRIRGGEVLSVNMEIGKREPAHCTAVGKCLLCNFGPDELRELFDAKLPKYTPRTIVTFKRLCHELNAVRKQRYALDMEEYKSGVMCIAIPIYDNKNNIVCSIGVSGPVERINKQKDLLLSCLREVSNRYDMTS